MNILYISVYLRVINGMHKIEYKLHTAHIFYI